MQNKKPKWHGSFVRLIQNCWQNHGPSENINVGWAYNKKTRCWGVVVSPVYQEVLGGEDDGKQVWTGFVFTLDQFLAAEGVFVTHFACASKCNECSASPRVMVIGKYFGYRFFLEVLLEPIPDTPTREILDTINQKVITKEITDDSESQRSTDGGDEGEKPGEGHPPSLPGSASEN